jgi:hypothetical protein
MSGGLLSGTVVSTAPRATVDPSTRETLTKVRRALERLPYYGVFDFLAFGVEDGAVVLKGYAHRPALKKEAEEMKKSHRRGRG